MGYQEWKEAVDRQQTLLEAKAPYRSLMKAIASRLRTPLREQTLVARFPPLRQGEGVWAPLIFLRRGRRNLAVGAGMRFVLVHVIGGLNTLGTWMVSRSPLTVTVGRRPWRPATLPGNDPAFHLYVPHDAKPQAIRQSVKVIRSAPVQNALIHLQLRRWETLCVKPGELAALLKPTDAERIASAGAALVDLFEAAAVEETAVNLRALPRQFHALIPLIEKWGLSDDVERAEVQRTASTKERRTFLKVVTPYLRKIDDYLDDHDTEAAHALGRLAEAAAEVSL
jgi:hypothetical protein